MKKYIFVTGLIFLSLQMNAQKNDTIFLYGKEKIPYNKIDVIDKEYIKLESDSNRRIYAVVNPLLYAYYPENSNGKAIIICPGGAYKFVSMDKEGLDVAEQLSQWGYTCFVLKYRIPDDKFMDNKAFVPLTDAQQAMRYVRSNAMKLHLDKIGIMGFSAGGHLAATLSTQFDYDVDSTKQNNDFSLRPDFSILVYPVISFDSALTHAGSVRNLLGANPTKEQIHFFSTELNVTTNTPLVFLMHNSDDKTVPVANSILYYNACIKNGVPAEMHLYEKGGHGIGMNNKTTKDKWMERLKNWLDNL